MNNCVNILLALSGLACAVAAGGCSRSEQLSRAPNMSKAKVSLIDTIRKSADYGIVESKVNDTNSIEELAGAFREVALHGVALSTQGSDKELGTLYLLAKRLEVIGSPEAGACLVGIFFDRELRIDGELASIVSDSIIKAHKVTLPILHERAKQRDDGDVKQLIQLIQEDVEHADSAK